jgi:hypothetical protein
MIIKHLRLFIVTVGNNELRRICGFKKRRPKERHNTEIHNLCSSPDTPGMIRLRKIRWAGV